MNFFLLKSPVKDGFMKKKFRDFNGRIFKTQVRWKVWTYVCACVQFKCNLRLRETPAPDPVGIENCKQLFSPLLAFTTQKIATRSTDIISAARVAFFWVVNATRNEKSCLQFLIPTAVFHMLLSPISSTKPIFRGHLAVLKTVLTIFAGLTYGLRTVLEVKYVVRLLWCM